MTEHELMVVMRIAAALEGQLADSRAAEAASNRMMEVLEASAKRQAAFIAQQEAWQAESTARAKEHNRKCEEWHRRVMEHVGIPTEPAERVQ